MTIPSFWFIKKEFMGKFILKLLPPGTPKRVEQPPLSNFHPAFAMDERNRKAYMTVIIDMLPTKLDNKLLRKACEPMFRRLYGRIWWDSTYWTRRELIRNRDSARQLHCGSDYEFSRHETVLALHKFNSEVSDKKREKAVKALPTGGAWLRGAHKKAMLFLDCACVLRDTNRLDVDSLIDDVVEELVIDRAIVALVKTYVASPDEGPNYKITQIGGGNYIVREISEQYHKVCADIAALVKPAPVKKKTVAAKKAAVKKAAAKKAAIKMLTT
jgi:hypothetical protein